MQNIVQSLKLGLILRNFFAGVFFDFGYIYAAGVPCRFHKTDGLTYAIAISITLVAGVTTYALHRAMFIPVMECIHYSSWFTKCRRKCPLTHKRAIVVMIKRWDDSASDDKVRRSRADVLREWADYIHLLYCSFLCFVFGNIFGCWSSCLKTTLSGKVVVIVLILFFGGFISDWRRHHVEYVIRRKERKERRKSGTKTQTAQYSITAYEVKVE